MHLYLQQVIVDILDRLEFRMRLFSGTEHIWMAAIIAVDVADIFEVLAPFINTQKVEIGRGYKIDRLLIAMKEPPDF